MKDADKGNRTAALGFETNGNTAGNSLAAAVSMRAPMGAKAKHRKEFLAKHPVCCFCGGVRPAEEPDHVPSRVLFDDRQWPEGFEFPACVKCNRATRHDEQVVAMLSRIYPDPTTEKGRAETYERIRAAAHNYPEILEEMRPTARQLRKASEKYGLGESYADLPALSVKGPRINAAIENVGRKLFCALYYMHTGQIVPPDGGVAIRWFTNVQIDADEIPRSLAPLLANFGKTERSRTKLDDQFFYRWVVPSDSKNVAAFLAFFRRSFALLGYVNCNAADFHKLGPDAKVVRPYVWE